MSRRYPHLPAPGLDWLPGITSGLRPERRIAILELLELARFGLANATHNKFAEISTEDIDRAMAALALLQTS